MFFFNPKLPDNFTALRWHSWASPFNSEIWMTCRITYIITLKSWRKLIYMKTCTNFHLTKGNLPVPITWKLRYEGKSGSNWTNYYFFDHDLSWEQQRWTNVQVCLGRTSALLTGRCCRSVGVLSAIRENTNKQVMKERHRGGNTPVALKVMRFLIRVHCNTGE